MRTPKAFAFSMRPPEGGWLEVGELAERPIRWWTNPRHIVGPAWRRVVDLWARSRGGMGVGWLPCGGGVNDQPAWLMTAFAVLGGEDARLERARDSKREAES